MFVKKNFVYTFIFLVLNSIWNPIFAQDSEMDWHAINNPVPEFDMSLNKLRVFTDTELGRNPSQPFVLHIAVDPAIDIRVQLNPLNDELIVMTTCNMYYIYSPAKTIFEELLLRLETVYFLQKMNLYMARSDDGAWMYFDLNSLSADCGQSIEKVEILLPQSTLIQLSPLKRDTLSGPTSAQKSLPKELQWKEYVSEFTLLKSLFSKFELESELERIKNGN